MRRTIELDQGWTLYRSSDDFQVGKAVRVPHDAMLSEERSEQAVTGNAGAYFPGGTYRYERVIDVDPKWADKVVTLELEGVYQKASVLVDGTEVAHNDYGYTGFYVNLAPHLTPGGRNVLTVVADNSHQPNSRWYSGSGMYRPARLYVQEQDHIALGGVRITTESTEVAQVRVLTQLEGEGDVLVSVWRDGVKVAAGQGTDVVLAIPDARLWSAEEPNLYECRVSLRWGRAVVDEERLAFGIRDVTWGPFGLRVNGCEVLLRGGCVHHTQGILGAAEPAEAAWREVALLKEHGFNAIRSAHNPISKAMLDACDHLGMYVMDEFADMWYEHKNPCDYASDFETSWEADLAAMVRKDMSHPSVLMYSIGNENAEPRDERGVAWYRIIAGEKEGWVSSRYTELIGESAKAVDEAEVAEAVEPAPTDAPASQNALFAGLLFGSDASKEETDEKAEVEGTDEPVTDAPAEEPAEEAAETPTPVSANAPARTVELSTYYLRNLVEAANEIGLISYRQVESEVPYQYYDKALILAGNQQVESIVVYGPGYEIYGVSVGMDINAARACLNAAGLDYVESVNGVTYEHKATGASLFTDPSGHDSCINVWVNDGGTVTEIDWSTYTG